jgi:hypothetical protein
MDTREPVVWLIQESWTVNADLSSAQRYGKIETILSSADVASLAPGPCLTKIRQAFKRYRPGDFICYALADPAAILLVGLVLAEQRLDREPIQWLRWERERTIEGKRVQGGIGFYTPTIIDLKGKRLPAEQAVEPLP